MNWRMKNLYGRARTTLSDPAFPFIRDYLAYLGGFGTTRVASFLGYDVVATGGAETRPLSELRAYLATLNLTWFLRRIAEVSSRLDRGGSDDVSGVQVSRHSLAYLALVAIESSSDDVVLVPDFTHVAEAARLFNALRDPLVAEAASDDAALEHAIRLGYSQLSGGVDLKNLVARALLLFGEIWVRSPEASQLDVVAAINALTGLNHAQLTALGFALSGQALSTGFVAPYDASALAKFPAALGIGASQQALFLEWVSASYAEIRQAAAQLPVPNETYEKYRLSPFLTTPLVRPDRPPTDAPKDVYLAPTPTYLARRVTDGVYHALSKAHEGARKENAFRAAFGFAFQEYVGALLEAGSPKGSVLREWTYGKRGQRRQTPDWLVLEGDCLLVIEVKQSVVTLQTKILGHMDVLTASLERTLAAAVRQLLGFKRALLTDAPGLARLSAVRHVELLVVTFDEVPFGNWVMRDAIANRVDGANDVQICSIDEFENLQRYCWGSSPFEMVSVKRENASAFDFGRWLQARGEAPFAHHPFLRATFDRLMASYGLSAPADLDA